MAWNLPAQQSRHGRCARTLDDELRAFEQQHDGLRDLLVRHRLDRLEALLEDRAGERARVLHSDPVRDGRSENRASGIRRTALGLDTDELHGRPHLAESESDS